MWYIEDTLGVISIVDEDMDLVGGDTKTIVEGATRSASSKDSSAKRRINSGSALTQGALVLAVTSSNTHGR